MKRLKTLCITLLVFTGNMYAAPVTSASSGDWNNPATWVGGVAPLAGDNVTIANGHTVTVTANASCASLIIGNGALNQSSTLTINTGTFLIISGNINITAPLSGTTDNMLDVNAGNVSCTSLFTSNSLNNSLRCIVSISTGTLTCSGSFSMANSTSRNKLIFSGAGLLQIAQNGNTLADAQFTASTGTVEYNGTTGQAILPLSYHTLKGSGTSLKVLTANTTISGDLIISGAAQLDVNGSANYSLAVAGNWTITSTNPNPFIERKGTVTLNGTSGVQALATTIAQETFYNLTINNTAGNATADLEFNKNCLVLQSYTHTNGNVNLKGNKLSVVSENRQGIFTTCALSGGSITSTVSGSQISFIDSYDSTFVNFTGTSIGDNNIPVALAVNTGRINLENLTLYGTGSFTKRHAFDDITSKGGNKFYNTTTFTANTNAGSWFTGAGNGALADSFFAKAYFYSYASNSNSKIITGANSSGNYYADDVIFYIRSAGSICIGNSSGAANGTNSSHYFNKQVDVWLTSSGNITFAEGSGMLASAVTFNNILKLTSATGSTGSIYVGKNVTGSSIVFTSTGQLTNGNLYGNTSIYLYNITQTGILPQSLSNVSVSTSKIIVGHINGSCIWNGPVSFTAPVLDIAYNIFNGSNNVFNLKNSAAAQSCTGGNTFASGTSTSFNSFTNADWYFATVAPDDYNGNVSYRINVAGTMYPAYNNNCTYAGNIVVQPGSDTVIFAAATNGRLTIDGNTSTYFINNGVKPTDCKRLTINKSGGTFTLYSHLYMQAGGNLTLSAGRAATSSSGMLILQDESCTVTANTAASTSYIDGPIRIDVSSTAIQTLHFPVGKDLESRPVDLTIQHSTISTV